MSDLSKKHCVPCEGETSPLSHSQSEEYLDEIDKWHLVEDKYIEKILQFKDFKQALLFLNKVGEIAENEGHHPDIGIVEWNKVKIVLTTHVIGGLSDNDFILASKIDSLNYGDVK
jgi:4a-hydroxytetrahydrobiopterin dehydratase